MEIGFRIKFFSSTLWSKYVPLSNQSPGHVSRQYGTKTDAKIVASFSYFRVKLQQSMRFHSLETSSAVIGHGTKEKEHWT